MRVKSYRDVFEDYKTHPEPKSAGADGLHSGRSTHGLLGHLHVRPTMICYVGKESNRVDDVNAGLVTDVADVREMYTDPKGDPWLTSVVPILLRIPRRELSHASQMSERSVQAARNGRSRPRARKRALLTRAAAGYARAQLGAARRPTTSPRVPHSCGTSGAGSKRARRGSAVAKDPSPGERPRASSTSASSV